MGSQIKTPALDETTPPYFHLDIGHSAKVFADGEALWVKIIDIRGDEFLGVVRGGKAGPQPYVLCEQDVISFERQHIFGMF